MKKGVLLTAMVLAMAGACREPESKTIVKEVEVERPQRKGCSRTHRRKSG